MDHTNLFFPSPIERDLQNSRLIALFAKEQNTRVFAKGQMVYSQGEHAEAFYYLKSGRAVTFLSSENGTEKILALQKPGSVFGEASFFDELPRMSSARALEKTELVVINQPMMLKYFRTQPETALDLLRYLARTVRMLSSHVDNMAFLHADRRIAQLLVQMCRDEDGRLVAGISQEELGNMASVSRMTVSRVLGRFVEAGWVRVNYRMTELCDFPALQEFAFTSDES